MVGTLIYHCKLANQIARLPAIVVKKFFLHAFDLNTSHGVVKTGGQDFQGYTKQLLFPLTKSQHTQSGRIDLVVI